MAKQAATAVRQRPLAETTRESLWKHLKLDYNDPLNRCRFIPAVAERFEQIADALSEKEITYGCTATGEPAAECATAGAVTWTTPPRSMALCSSFWNQTPLRQGTWLLHEWVHYEFGTRGAGDELPGGFDTAGCYASFALEASGNSTGMNEELNCNANTTAMPALNKPMVEKVPCGGNTFLNVSGTVGVAAGGAFPARLTTEIGLDYLFPLTSLHDWELSVGGRYTNFRPSKAEDDSAYTLGARVALQFRYRPWRFGWQAGGYVEGGRFSGADATGKDITTPYVGGGVVGGLNIPLGKQSSMQLFVDVGEKYGLNTGDPNQLKWFQAGFGIAFQAQ